MEPTLTSFNKPLQVFTSKKRSYSSLFCMVAVETVWALEDEHWLYMETRNQDILFQIRDSKNYYMHLHVIQCILKHIRKYF